MCTTSSCIIVHGTTSNLPLQGISSLGHWPLASQGNCLTQLITPSKVRMYIVLGFFHHEKGGSSLIPAHGTSCCHRLSASSSGLPLVKPAEKPHFILSISSLLPWLTADLLFTSTLCTVNLEWVLSHMLSSYRGIAMQPKASHLTLQHFNGYMTDFLVRHTYSLLRHKHFLEDRLGLSSTHPHFVRHAHFW